MTIKVQVGFLNGDAVETPLSIFEGRCVGVSTGYTEQGFLTTAKFSGPLAKLDDSLSVLLTDAAQRQIAHGDTSLQYIHQTRQLEWGR